MEDEINILREILNEMLDKQDKEPSKILEVSKQLDSLIVEYYQDEEEYNEVDTEGAT